MPRPFTPPPRTLTPEQIVAKLRRLPYNRACREGADLIEDLLREKATREGRPQ